VSTGGRRRRATTAARKAQDRRPRRQATAPGRDLAPPSASRRNRRSRATAPKPPRRGLALPASLSARPLLRAGLLLVEVVALILLVSQPAFAAAQVEVNGARHLSRQHILDRAGLSAGTSIFMISTTTAEGELAGDPYIRSATVRALLPNQVRVDVTEWEAVALVTRGNARYLVNEQGNVLTTTTDGAVGANPGQPHIPIVEEDDGGLSPGHRAVNARLLTDLDHMQATFPTAFKLTVSQFRIQAGGQLVVETTGGPRILFGQMVTDEQIDSLDPKLATLKSLSGSVDLGHSGLDYVNLENPNAPAVHALPSPSPSPRPSPRPAASPTKKP
jgi:cell division septal protein FtsQ